MEIRAKDATYQITVDGVRQGGSFATIKDITIRPDVEIAKKRFAGEKRHRGDLDVKGYDFSFKNEKRDHTWWTIWKKFETAENNGNPFPVVTIAVTARYRDGSGNLRTITLHGDLVMKPDEDSMPLDQYQEVSWSGTCGYASGI